MGNYISKTGPRVAAGLFVLACLVVLAVSLSVSDRTTTACLKQVSPVIVGPSPPLPPSSSPTEYPTARVVSSPLGVQYGGNSTNQKLREEEEDEEGDDSSYVEVFCCYQNTICRAEISVSARGTTTLSKPQTVFRDLAGQVLDMTTVDSTVFFQVGQDIYWADQEGRARPRKLEGMPEPAEETTGLQSDGEHLYWVGSHTGSLYQDTRLWRQLGTHVQQFHISRATSSGEVWIAAVDTSGAARYVELTQDGEEHVRSAAGFAPLPVGTKLLPTLSLAPSGSSFLDPVPRLFTFDAERKTFFSLRAPPAATSQVKPTEPAEELPAESEQKESKTSPQPRMPKTRKQRAEDRKKALALVEENRKKKEELESRATQPAPSWNSGDPIGADLFTSVDKLFVHRGLGRDRVLVQTKEGELLAWDRRVDKVERVRGNVGGVTLITSVDQDFDWESPPPALTQSSRVTTKTAADRPPLPEGCLVS